MIFLRERTSIDTIHHFGEILWHIRSIRRVLIIGALCYDDWGQQIEKVWGRVADDTHCDHWGWHLRDYPTNEETCFERFCSRVLWYLCLKREQEMVISCVLEEEKIEDGFQDSKEAATAANEGFTTAKKNPSPATKESR